MIVKEAGRLLLDIHDVGMRIPTNGEYQYVQAHLAASPILYRV